MDEAEPVGSRSSWQSPLDDLSLDEDEVHVWRAALTTSLAQRVKLERVLSADERARAKRFKFDKHRVRYVAAHGILRRILAKHLRTEPASLAFEFGSRGKPSLVDHESLEFNMSDSGDLGLIAVTLGRRVGVDVERVRTDVAGLRMAKRFFSEREAAVLTGLPAELRCKAFFDCWTRKEAYIKAWGEGLYMPLDRFDVSLAPGEPAALLRTYDDPSEAERWRIRELPVGPDYAAAVAVEARDWRLRLWQWPG